MRATVNLEVSCLKEPHHTGVSNVAKHLARQLLGDPSVEPAFWFNRQRISQRIMEDIVRLDGAPHLPWLAGRLDDGLTTGLPAGPSVGVFPSHKWHRRFFDHETLIVHDLTAVILPQYHTAGAVAHENGRLLPDILSSDLLITVSESTRRDLRDYFPQARHIPAEVVHLAPCCAPPEEVPHVRLPPYVMVLGTLEPRKNVAAVLEMLRREPAWLERLNFVFVGRWGWGDSVASLVAQHGLQDDHRLGRIQFPGFVSDTERDVLVANAQCLVYPSRYEGFGLPVLEALKLGTPVVTGEGSSLPEAGGPFAQYVDVDSAASLSSAIHRAIGDNAPETVARRKAWADTFSWWKTYERIRDLALADATKPQSAPA
jgi:glycosyltransferase involved in cell wall biosynthesis